MASPPSLFDPPARRSRSGQPILLFGHRGYSALAPENTLAAFAALLERSIPGVELDVQLSRDGKVVVFHDDNLKRITGVDAELPECSLKKLRSLDAGAWFDASFWGERIPLLDEVFDLLGDRVYYDVELKAGKRESRGLEKAVLERIRAHKLKERCLISSFNPYCIRTVQQIDPSQPTAHIYSRHRSVPFLLRHGESSLLVSTPFVKPQARQVHLISAALYRHVLNKQILTWTVDDPQEATRLIHLGVRGIISNHPGKIKAAIRTLRSP